MLIVQHYIQFFDISMAERPSLKKRIPCLSNMLLRCKTSHQYQISNSTLLFYSSTTTTRTPPTVTTTNGQFLLQILLLSVLLPLALPQKIPQEDNLRSLLSSQSHNNISLTLSFTFSWRLLCFVQEI